MTKQHYRLDKFEFYGDPLPYKQKSHLQKKLRNARRFEQSLLANYNEAVMSQDRKRVGELKWRYLRSKKVWLALFLEINNRTSVSDRLDATNCLSIAAKLGMKNLQHREKVSGFLKVKPSGKSRPICVFGLRYRTYQLAIKNLITPKIRKRVWQYDLKGGHAAIKSILKDMENGFTHYYRLDIRNFFGSFEGKELPKALPVPRKLVESVAIARHLKVHVDPSPLEKVPHTLAGTFRRGIPQGAISSPSIATYIISQLDIDVPKDIRLFSYVDDYVILGKKKSAVQKFAKNLKVKLLDLPGGTFELRFKRSLVGEDGLLFLGYRFAYIDDKVTCEIGHVASSEIYQRIQRLSDRLLKYQSPNKIAAANQYDIERLLVSMWKRVQGWCEYFKYASDLQKQFNFLMIKLKEEFNSVGLTIDDVLELAESDRFKELKYEWYSSSH